MSRWKNFVTECKEIAMKFFTSYLFSAFSLAMEALRIFTFSCAIYK
jgi:hypothetical protein